jgi:membrane protein DedA with SNARE-associated domain
MRVSYLKFLSFDGFAALISVPFFVWLGSWLWLKFGDDIESLNRALARTERLSLWVGILAVVAAIGVWLWSRRRRNGL